MTLGWPMVLGGLLALAIIVAAILLAPLLFRRRRTKGLTRSGARLRCHSLPDGRRLPAEELKSLPGLEEIQTGALTNLLHRRDLDVATYICDWPTGRKLQTLALLRFDSVIFPDFELRPSVREEKDGITFAGYPEFNHRYRLRFRDFEHPAPEIFNPELLRFLERQARPLSISASGRWLMVFREDTPVQPEELSSFLGEVHSIAGTIKRSVSVQTQLPK